MLKSQDFRQLFVMILKEMQGAKSLVCGKSSQHWVTVDTRGNFSCSPLGQNSFELRLRTRQQPSHVPHWRRPG